MELEDLKLRIREILDGDRIKLWLPPYEPVRDGFPDPLVALADKYCTILKNRPSKEVLVALEDLRKHSIERYRANEHFRETGVATLRISVPAERERFDIRIGVTESGGELVRMVADRFKIQTDRLKLIHKGRIVKRDETLECQLIKNASQILTIILCESPESTQKYSDLYMKLESTKRDAELLSEDRLGEQYMRLENQSGEMLDLPLKDKKALSIAMTLHEKGRSALKSNHFSVALVYFLEADRYFCECSGEILNSVDNYALLNLDIVWCYLCLQSVTHIPDADRRLLICEKNFYKSYGDNLERLVALKGSSGNEKALLMRLHLLRAIVHYHQNEREEAKKLFEKAERELNSLKVDENSLCLLMELGYTTSKSRLALRACNGDVQSAIDFIEKTKKDKLESHQKAINEKKNRLLGYCDDGVQYISIDFVNLLIEMGFSKKLAILALKKSNNNVSNAIQIIQDHPEQLNFADLPLNISFEDESSYQHILKRLTDLGYDIEVVKHALKQTANDFGEALDLLMNFGGSMSSCGETSKTKNREELKKKREETKAAYKRLLNEIETEDDDYLDLDLKQEEVFLQQYMCFFK